MSSLRNYNIFVFVFLLAANVLLTGCLESDGSSFGQLDPGAADDRLVVRIVSQTPASSSVVLTDPAYGSTNPNPSSVFSVTATGKKSLSYTWYLDGSPVTSGVSSYTLTGSSLSVGNHTFKVTASDGSTSDSRTWDVKKNVPPTISAFSVVSPTPNRTYTDTTYKINYGATATFSVTASDGNSDTLTYEWYVNGSYNHSTISTSPSVANNNSDTIIFTPTSAIIGSNTVMVKVKDGTEEKSQSWTVEVNYFPESCNRLAVGEGCTLVGNPSVGKGLKPTDDQARMKIRTRYMLDDGTGNLFISDDINHVIWYYNRSGSTKTFTLSARTINVAAGTVEPILGTGAAGNTTSNADPLKFSINTPEQVYYDSTYDELYVADRGNGRILKYPFQTRIAGVRPATTAGVVSRLVYGGGCATAGAQNGSAVACSTPVGVVGIGNNLYATCASNHYVIKVDLTTSVNSTYLAAGTCNTAGSTQGAAPGILMNSPRHLAADSANNIYWSNIGDCTIKMLRPSSEVGNTIWYSGAGDQVSTAPGNISIILGSTAAGGSCGSAVGAPLTTTRLNAPYSFAVKPDRSGLFVSHGTNFQQIMYVNNSGAAKQFGGAASVANNTTGIVANTGGTAGFNSDGNIGANARMYQLYGLSFNNSGNTLFLADLQNIRLRTFDLSSTSGIIDTILGSGKQKAAFVGDVELPVTDHFMNTPSGMTIDTTNRILYFTDTGNARIRAVDLLKGTMKTAIAKSGTAGTIVEDDFPSNVILSSPRGLAMQGGKLFYNDQQNNACVTRTWNIGTAISNIFNVTMNADRVSTVAGDYNNGCTSNNGNSYSLNANMSNLEGISSNGTSLFSVDTTNNCVYKITPITPTGASTSAAISTVVGTCGTAGNVEGPVVGSQLNVPLHIVADPSYPTNFFLSDGTNSGVGNSKILYVNNDPSNDVSVNNTTVIRNGNSSNIELGCNQCRGIAANTTTYCFSSNASQTITCKVRSSGAAADTWGSSGQTNVVGGPLGTEQEGVAANLMTFNNPYALTFDSNGNLYIIDRGNHLIRFIKRSSQP